MSPKKILILGAGPFQLPAIEKAIAMGLHVITMDYKPDNVGHHIAHQTVNCSTTNREGALQAAHALDIDGVCTFSSDVAIPTVAFICEKRRLPGPSLKAAETMARKHRFRRFLQDENLPHPRFVTGDAFEDVVEAMADLTPPLMVKPVDTSGSRGVSRLDFFEPQMAQQAFSIARSYSPSDTVCVEEFLEGREVGGDGMLQDGRFAFLSITHKYLDGFVVTGHRLPNSLSSEEEAKVRQCLEKACGALGYTNGPLNFDVMLGPEKTTILEMSARNGGNGIPAVIERSTGVDVEKATLLMALGEKPLLEKRPEQRGAGSSVFGVQKEAIFRGGASLKKVQGQLPELFALHYALKPGERVQPFIHNGNMLGYGLFDCEDDSDYNRICRDLVQALDLRLENPAEKEEG